MLITKSILGANQVTSTKGNSLSLPSKREIHEPSDTDLLTVENTAVDIVAGNRFQAMYSCYLAMVEHMNGKVIEL